jgi:hypothetical protein
MIGPTIHFRYPFKPMPPANESNKLVKCITIGAPESGKTTLIKILCGLDLKSGSSNMSKSRNVIEVESL